MPLHGRGNENGRGAGVRILAYSIPDSPATDDWPIQLVDDRLHVTHNLDPVQWDSDPAEEILVCSQEGLFCFDPGPTGWKATQLADPHQNPGFNGASEIRAGYRPGRKCFLATIEPFHGHQVVVYTPPEPGKSAWQRHVIDDTLQAGHAVATGDLLGLGYDQLVVGWRQPNADGNVGINLYLPPTSPRDPWTSFVIDHNSMACEDLKLADLNQDGRPDIIASGRATHNLKIYLNTSPASPR